MYKNKKCAAEAAYEKYIAPTVAKHNLNIYSISVCRNRASVFLPKGTKIHTLSLSYIQICLASLV